MKKPVLINLQMAKGMTMNYHVSDYGEMIKWRRLALCSMAVTAFCVITQLLRVLGGH